MFTSCFLLTLLGASLTSFVRAVDTTENTMSSSLGTVIEFPVNLGVQADIRAEEQWVSRSDLMHMFLSLSTQMWKITPPEEINTQTFLDDRVPMSQIIFNRETTSAFSTKDLGGAMLLSIESTMPAQGMTMMNVRLPELTITTHRSQGRRTLGYLRPAIGVGGANSNSTGAAVSTTTNNNFRLLVSTRGRPLQIGPQLSLLYTAIIQMAYTEPHTKALSDEFRGQDTCGESKRDGVTLRICFEKLNQSGKRATFDDLEAVLREMMLKPAIKTNPESFVASAYLMSNGRRLPRKFLELIMARTEDMPPRNVGFQIPNITAPTGASQSGIVEITS